VLSQHPTDDSYYYAGTESAFKENNPSYQKITLEQFRQITNPKPQQKTMKKVSWKDVVAKTTESSSEAIAQVASKAIAQALAEIAPPTGGGEFDPEEVRSLVREEIEGQIGVIVHRPELKDALMEVGRVVSDDLEQVYMARFESLTQEAERKASHRVEVYREGVSEHPSHVEEIAHHNLHHLIKMVALKLNVALIGEAGSGKTFGAEQAANALGLRFLPMSFHAKMTATDIKGYCDANGNYVPSILYDAFKNGGVLCLDEFDRSNTEVTVSLNNMLAGSAYMFPNNEIVRKHDDFRVIACQNTTGSGGSKTYAAASRQDSSTLNRFVKIEWNIDETMERKVAGDNHATEKVQAIRRKARELGVDIVISPRQSIHVNALMNAGYSLGEALNYAIYNCLADDVKERLSRV
jgi:MoxR-like ATPase